MAAMGTALSKTPRKAIIVFSPLFIEYANEAGRRCGDVSCSPSAIFGVFAFLWASASYSYLDVIECGCDTDTRGRKLFTSQLSNLYGAL